MYLDSTQFIGPLGASIRCCDDRWPCGSDRVRRKEWARILDADMHTCSAMSSRFVWRGGHDSARTGAELGWASTIRPAAMTLLL